MTDYSEKELKMMIEITVNRWNMYLEIKDSYEQDELSLRMWQRMLDMQKRDFMHYATLLHKLTGECYNPITKTFS